MAKIFKRIDIGILPIPTLYFFIFHFVIVYLVRRSTTFSTSYAIAIFAIGALAALTGRHSAVLCIISYIIGSEVLWRMTRTYVFWEFSKYSISGIIILSFLRRPRINRSIMPLFIYFVLLLPAICYTGIESFSVWREVVSFNMSGPLSLFLCGLYFSGLSIDMKDFQRMVAWLAAPVISTAFIVLIVMKSSAHLIWSLGSSRLTSGYYGPNQVSSILGLAAFLCIISILISERQRILRTTYIFISIWFLGHALLTFSRGGVVGAVLPLMIFIGMMAKDRKTRITIFSFGIIFIYLFSFILVPKLNKYTGGKLEERYAMREKVGETEVYHTSGRLDLIITDLAAFRQNILFGVGVGNAGKVHLELGGRHAGTHTEWSRALVEHGILGLFALIFLWIWVMGRYRQWYMRGPASRALALSFIVWIAIYMTHSAMRLAAPSFIAGLLAVHLNLITPAESKTKKAEGVITPDSRSHRL